jgi:hypothetical protein
VFLVNSRLGLVTAASFSYEEAPLLPKLRGHFAEFLRESYLAPLGILYLPTCVGFGYRCILIGILIGLLYVVRAFLGSMTSVAFSLAIRKSTHSSAQDVFYSISQRLSA